MMMRSLSTTRGFSTIKQVAVYGSGLMGSGIVQVAAASNHKVTLWDMNDDLLNKAKNNITKSLSRVANKKFVDDAAGAQSYIDGVLNNISFTTSQEAGAAESDLVLEVIVENLKIKQELFAKLDKVAPAHAIFASNTSSLPIADICNNVRPENFGGLHFFNPVPMMKLVEVVATDESSTSTINALTEFGKNVGKTTVACKDTPGFIVNRLLVPYMAQAVNMYERGDASKEDIDTAMKLGAGYPMGPFQLSDYVGLDTLKFIMDGWAEKYPHEEAFRPSKVVADLVAQGKLGMKSGEGFYKYNKK
jgi:3-hydroxyacyl-CoA dehydrogenase